MVARVAHNHEAVSKGSNPTSATMDEKNRHTEYENAIADIILEKPYGFSIGRKPFRLYPITLAKTLLLRGYYEALEIDHSRFRQNMDIEVLRIIKASKYLCCTILAIHSTPNTYKDLYNKKAIAEKRNVFMGVCDEDLASHMINMLQSDKMELVMEESGINKEIERMHDVMKVKKETNYVHFGCKTVFGQFIAPLLELGFTADEILFERSYAFLRLILADKEASIYLTDEEQHNLGEDAGGRLIDGDSAEGFAKLKSFMAGRGVKFND